MVESNADTLLKSKATQQSNDTEANPYNECLLYTYEAADDTPGV